MAGAITAAMQSGAIAALAAGLLFGASTPFAKMLVGAIDPGMLAGLLYLGSGGGLAIFHLIGRSRGASRRDGPAFGARDWLALAGATACGGVIAPLLLMLGLARIAAGSTSLLLNLESVFTAIIAWFVFGENFDRRIVAGMAAIAGGATLLAWQGEFSAASLFGVAAIVGACFAWALDNNLTRIVSLGDPLLVATVKGLVAGSINILIALYAGASIPEPAGVAAAAVLGFAGYGISLVLYVMALARLGAARTGAYFAIAPFVGALVAVAAFGESLTWQIAIAAPLMAWGVWLHLTERHEHEHEHEPIVHSHRHWHDEHHRHAHTGDEPPGEPHAHAHVHARLRHRHPHYPDAHHRHPH